MLDKRLMKVGKLTIESGEVKVIGFEAADCSCRDVAALSLLWAIGELQRELNAIIDRPGGTGNVVID